MSTTTETAPTPTTTGRVRLVHMACHCTYPETICLCGHIGTYRARRIDGPRCVVCTDLASKPCERCGR